MENDFDTTMEKADLIALLEKELSKREAELKKKEGPFEKAMAAHVKHVAVVLQKASQDVLSGKLKMENGRWCNVRQHIEDRVGSVPEGVEAIVTAIYRYKAAIQQIKYMRGGPTMRVTTSQVQTWLSGHMVTTRRRR